MTYVPSSLSTGAGHSRYVSSTTNGFTTGKYEQKNGTFLEFGLIKPNNINLVVIWNL